jgi:hypothetical protein
MQLFSSHPNRSRLVVLACLGVFIMAPGLPAQSATSIPTTGVPAESTAASTQAAPSPQPSASPETPSPVEPVATDAATPNLTWKLMRGDSIALEARFGSVLWSGFAWPEGANGATVNTNGINGKNFLYPTIPILGVGGRFALGQYIRLTPSLDFVFDEYVYRADLDRAFRTQEMTGKAVGPLATVMGLLVSVPVWFDLPLTEHMVLSLAPGLAFYPRIAVAGLDGSDNIDKISTDLNKEAKWLYPQTGVAFNYALADWFSANVQIQVMYPIYHLWSTDGLPFYDSMMLVGTIGFDFFF